jgi:hypothetical protein
MPIYRQTEVTQALVSADNRTVVSEAKAEAENVDTAPISPVTAVNEPTWREAGDDEDSHAVLKGTWQLGPMRLHVIAIAVHLEDKDDSFPIDAGRHVMLDKGARAYDIDELWGAHGMDGLPETIEIYGRHYAVFASPYCK